MYPRTESNLSQSQIVGQAITSIDDLPDFDAAQFLDSEAAIAAYLADILQAGDDGLLAAALGDIARARGMTEIARAAGLTREALYKALRPESKPRFDTIRRVCLALGVRLRPEPVVDGVAGGTVSA